jgi:hypothetical protein
MSETREKDARLRDVFVEPVERVAMSPDCPNDDTIWKAAHGEADAGTTASVLDHVASCAACTESWHMARTITAEAGVRKRAVVLPFHRRPAIWTLGAVAAGIVLVALFFPTILDRRGIDPGDEFRVVGSVTVESLLDEGTPVPRDGVILRWGGAPEGTLYTVEVADGNLEVLARSRSLEQAEYRVPAEALAGLPAGVTVYWRVEAVLPDSTPVSSSVFLLELQ